MGDIKFSGAGSRLRDLDCARGSGMLLVVIGHMHQFAEAKFWIYLFHMPMFFIVSGILFRPREPWSYSISRTRSLMLPYVVFFIVVLSLDNAVSTVSGIAPSLSLAAPKQIVLRFFYGGTSLFGAYAAFWFVGCLWLSLVALNFLTSIWKPISWPVAAVVAGLAVVALIERPGSPSPQGIASVPIAVVFLWVGCLLAEQRERRFLIAVVCAATGAASLPFVGVFDMKTLEIGNPVNLIAAVSLSVCWLAGNAYLDRVPYIGDAFSVIGRASITIMFLHALILKQGDAFIGNRYVLALAAVVIPVGVHWLLERSNVTCRYVLGQKMAPERGAVSASLPA
ncbi:fucose 4-O-acetylase-like acetyltransferase [Bradyrhizobium sacchari]|uniref:Fucose 4-O-acetylase-like acetyltransferase n=2 Tax=Bradyrhizobium sacchari TaxID=1399419 RepID=A0A560K002_9BRAD|nr:fucose 4-O-acetylase-like acetyltransferase [Bradyrhizobium sacchari]TWB76546.1 fucose 4-O-acetylase-like acetyltransferase [Bradyrhizobium sacchari]